MAEMRCASTIDSVHTTEEEGRIGVDIVHTAHLHLGMASDGKRGPRCCLASWMAVLN